MTKVSRKIYQEKVEQNKRLLRDIKILVGSNIPEKIKCKKKWLSLIDKESEVNKFISECVNAYMKNNPDDPAVIATKDIKR